MPSDVPADLPSDVPSDVLFDLPADPPPADGASHQRPEPATDSLTLGTDGACMGNPGPAGWAWVDEHGEGHSVGIAHGTNNIAELSAVLLALRDHPDVGHLVIQIDSTYARDCATTWRAGWERNGLKTSAKKPIKNIEIITEIWRELDNRSGTVEFVKVPGHDPTNQYPLNTAADLLCTEAAEAAKAGNLLDLRSTTDLATVKPRPVSFGRW